ncbi:unnamed protein product [Candida verbasci]|uniref:Uncharacterized protein n=1 Tax=Candida verbasci TaxID=1227364 RepID=A0A9W4TV39_9ASCO|nr:unnamed protein product [Candida verbasci]
MSDTEEKSVKYGELIGDKTVVHNVGGIVIKYADLPHHVVATIKGEDYLYKCREVNFRYLFPLDEQSFIEDGIKIKDSKWNEYFQYKTRSDDLGAEKF